VFWDASECPLTRRKIENRKTMEEEEK